MQNYVSQSEWLEARKKLLAQEKQLTRLQSELAQQRRQLPLVKVEKAYSFVSSDGNQTLADLFQHSRQLIVVHFMFGPDWQEGCPSCSFWADTYNGIEKHLQARDTQLVAVSNAPIHTIKRYKERLGWQFEWVSALDSDFSADFAVSFYDGDQSLSQQGYNYSGEFDGQELPGISAVSYTHLTLPTIYSV